MTPDWPAVIAWLRANDWRYGKAAKHFDLDPDEVRTVGRAAKDGPPPTAVQPPPLARAREDEPKGGGGPAKDDLLRLTPRQFRERKLLEIEEEIQKLRGEKGGATAYSHLQRDQLALRAALDKLTHEEGAEADRLDEMPDEELVRELRSEAEMLPEQHLRVFVDVWLSKHRMRVERDESKVQIIGGDREADA